RRRQSSCSCGKGRPRNWSKRMADMGWARSRGERAEKEGLRRGAWYRVVEESGKSWIVLDVHQVEVRVPTEKVETRKDRPKAWSVVHAASRVPRLSQATTRIGTAQRREMRRVRQQFRRGLAGSGIAVVPQSSATYRVVWAPVNSPEPVFFARWRHSPEGSGARGNSSPSGSVTRPFGSTSSRCWGLCSPAGASWRCCPRERGSR